MNKRELRIEYTARRKNLSTALCSQYNLQIYNHFFSNIDLSFIKVLHTYLPIEKNHEPDTWQILDRIKREFPQIRISVPRTAADETLENIYFEGLHQLKPNAWGISEPAQGVPTPADKIDLVLIPLLTFDKLGHRVGYGKGYYDRFLKDCGKNCQKIGLSFFEAVDRIDDVNEFDIRMNACITPSGFIVF
ncbi:MAG: 5-formyltetrahydrofolate cyclo-ligase [Cyclobacteriaceae bacterium]|nr:5-formyltetrahydrofolate cyclo-ligase [Cyclobacteriaceae bacterium]